MSVSEQTNRLLSYSTLLTQLKLINTNHTHYSTKVTKVKNDKHFTKKSQLQFAIYQLDLAICC